MQTERNIRAAVRALTLAAVVSHSGWANNVPPVKPEQEALSAALYRGDTAAAIRALKAGANVNAKNAEGTTPLVMAILHADEAAVRKLIERGADVNGRTGFGRTPLGAAASVARNGAMVKLLLDKGADPNMAASTPEGIIKFVQGGAETPLIEAAKMYDCEALDALLAGGAKPGAADASGNTPLHIAALFGNRNAVKTLLEHGAPVNVQTKLGGTPLMNAAIRNDAEIARLLLAAGADVKAVDGTGATPLMWAAYSESGNAAIVDMLLRAGADTKASSKVGGGENAMTWAKRNGDTAIVKRLREAGVSEAPAAAPGVYRHEPASVNTAVERAVAALQKSSPEFAKNTGCVSCHHQSLPGQAANMARSRGIPVNTELLEKDRKRVIGFMRPVKPVLVENTDMFPDIAISGPYLTWFLGDLDTPSEAVLESLSRAIALHQQADGRWVGFAPRPPLEFGDVQATALSIRALKTYASPERRAEYDGRVARAAAWLETAPIQADHSRVYQLLGLVWAGARPEALQRVANEILARQREDGGWAQLASLDSDAYATGQALYALHEANILKPSDAAFRRGVQYLLETQHEDGSWLVKTRVFPFQPLVDTKFPHGRDQWMSATGTSWAAMALTFAEPELSASAK